MVMAPIVTTYQLDPTGNNPNNLIINELHTLGVGKVRAIATHYGGYFKESVTIKEVTTQRILIQGQDYYCGEPYKTPSYKYGKEIYSIIVITDEDVVGDIVINYQALGGAWSSSQAAIIQMFDRVSERNRPELWGKLINDIQSMSIPLPATRITEAFGFEYTVVELQKIYQAILMGDIFAHDEIYVYVDNLVDGLFNKLDEDLVDHVLSGDHDWRYYTKDEMDDRFSKKGDGVDVAIDGPLSINKNTQYSWFITNYNVFSSYQVSVNQGNVNINNDKIFITVMSNQVISNTLILTVTRDSITREFEIRIF